MRCDKLYQVKDKRDGEIFDVVHEEGDEICILQEFDYATPPYKRTLEIWQPRHRYQKIDDTVSE